jgi:hypothetical protein
MSEPVAAEIVDVEGAELVPYEQPATLFGTSDPDAALERMKQIANVLVDVIRERKLFATIAGREHVTAEGWTTLGAMLGVVPVVVWTRPNESGDGYVARVEARTLDGRLVGAAESECSRAERTWKSRDAFALRSMAQTRAIGRALRAPLGQIVVLAGYEPAGAEELPNREREARAESASRSRVAPAEATKDQLAEIGALIRSLDECDPGIEWRGRAREIAGVPGDMLTKTVADMLIGKLREELAGAAG